MAARPLTGTEIRSLVYEVAARLSPGGEQHSLVMVGGSLLAWKGFRDSTEDVDTARRLDDELRHAVATIAAEHHLSPNWLNDDASMFLPATFDLDACEVLLDHPCLRVLGAPLETIFVMKMHRAHPNDIADLVTIWPHVHFSTARQVVQAYESAYPHAPEDPHLDRFVADLAARAGFTIPLR